MFHTNNIYLRVYKTIYHFIPTMVLSAFKYFLDELINNEIISPLLVSYTWNKAVTSTMFVLTWYNIVSDGTYIVFSLGANGGFLAEFDASSFAFFFARFKATPCWYCRPSLYSCIFLTCVLFSFSRRFLPRPHIPYLVTARLFRCFFFAAITISCVIRLP